MTQGQLLPLRRISGGVEELSDRALVSAVADGDQSALGSLYDRFHRDVYRFVGRLAPDTDAEDCVQLTFLEAHRSARRFRGHSAVKTWLFGIAANLVRTHVRSEVRKRRAVDAFAVQPRRPPTTPGDALTREQQQRMVYAALDALTPALREAYVLCVVEELPGKEAAQVLGIREASLWRRLSDAREALRVQIAEMQR